MLELHWPWILFAIPLPYFVFQWMHPIEKNKKEALIVPFYQRVSALIHNNTQTAKTNKITIFLLSAIWFFLILALAQPKWIGEPIPIPTSARSLMLAVDLSASMGTKDMSWHQNQVDRLVITKKILSDFIKRRKGDRIGLILFGSQAYLQSPITFDTNTVSKFLDESSIGMAGNSTAIGDAIGLSVKHLQENKNKNRVLILLTDGANTAGSVTPIQAAKLAHKKNIKIYSIGIGANEMLQQSLFGTQKINPSADLDEKTLQGMADLTNGRYFRATNTEELEKIYALMDTLEPVKQKNQFFHPSKTLYHWPLFFATILSWILSLIIFPSSIITKVKTLFPFNKKRK